MAISISEGFDCEPGVLWTILGDPGRADWVPGVEGCVLEDGVRSLSLPGAGAIKERILALDPARRRIEYSCIESPAPLVSHLASMQVDATEDGCQLTWETAVAPLAFEAFIRESMAGALARLHEIVDP